jgi:hypothetical protein
VEPTLIVQPRAVTLEIFSCLVRANIIFTKHQFDLESRLGAQSHQCLNLRLSWSQMPQLQQAIWQLFFFPEIISNPSLLNNQLAQLMATSKA